jgi:hypothetical protein
VLPARACDRDAKPPHAHTFPRIDLNPRHVLSFSRLILPVKRTATKKKARFGAEFWRVLNNVTNLIQRAAEKRANVFD